MLVGKKKITYNIINILVILFTAGWFIYDYGDINRIFEGFTKSSIIVLIVTIILVHMTKAIRLYFALYGTEIKRIDFFKTYCKVAPISVVIPFKLGEFFRMYYYGTLIGNVLKGIVIILLDRFMDTLALVTIIILTWMINGEDMISFIYVLLRLLVSVLIVYFVYPGIY